MYDAGTIAGFMIFAGILFVSGLRSLVYDHRIVSLQGGLFNFIVGLFRPRHREYGILLIGRAVRILAVANTFTGALFIVYLLYLVLGPGERNRTIEWIIVIGVLGGFGLALLVNRLDEERNAPLRTLFLIEQIEKKQADQSEEEQV